MSRRSDFVQVAWILLSHALSIYLFVSGFFLTRYELKEFSSCESSPLDFLETNGSSVLLAKQNFGKDRCWTPKPRFKKLVVLLVDALRSDWLFTCLIGLAESRPVMYDSLENKPKTTSFRANYQ